MKPLPAVRRAQMGDLGSMIKLKQSVLLREKTFSDAKKRKEREEKGFFLGFLPLPLFFVYFLMTPHFYVAENKKRIQGFLAAFPNSSLLTHGFYKRIAPSIRWENETVKEYYQHKPAVFIDNVGVGLEWQRKGIGKALYQKLVEEIYPQYQYAFAAIMDDWVKNKASRKFFEKMGFKKAGIYHPPKKKSLLSKKINPWLAYRWLIFWQAL